MPLVSVVTPTWTRDRYLQETIDSVLGQTMRDLEYIIALDGSPEPVVRIAEAAAGRDPRVRVLRLPHRGIYPTLNAAFSEAHGAYVAQISDDDFWEPDFLEQCVAAFGGSPEKAAAVYADLYELHPDGTRTPYRRCEEPPLPGGFIPGMNINATLFSKVYLDRVRALRGRYFDESFRIMGDSNLIGEFLRTRAPIVHRDAFLLVYRRHAQQNWYNDKLRVTRFLEYFRYRHNAGVPLPLGETLWMARLLAYESLGWMPLPWWFVMGIPGTLRRRRGSEV